MHVIVTEMPATWSADVLAGASRTLTVPPTAVKGPKSLGGDAGVACVTPEDGTGSGRGTLTLISPVESEDGVAPEATKVETDVPVIALAPADTAAEATPAGTVTRFWKPVTLNCCPGDGSADERVAVVVASFITRFPSGVPTQ
jgi:hypothetical protein